MFVLFHFQTRMQLQQELENKDQDLTEMHEKLSKEQKISNHLTENISFPRQETLDLEKALMQVKSMHFISNGVN